MIPLSLMIFFLADIRYNLSRPGCVYPDSIFADLGFMP